MEVKVSSSVKSFTHISGDVTVLAGLQSVNEPIRLEADRLHDVPNIVVRVGGSYVKLLESQLPELIEGLQELGNAISFARGGIAAATGHMSEVLKSGVLDA